MKVNIPERGVIKEQVLDIDEEVSIVYGHNNSGKTSLLRLINDVMCSNLLKQFILGKESEMPVYIPTNRLVVSDKQTENEKRRDLEDFIHYQQESFDKFDLHLKYIRDYLFFHNEIREFVSNGLYKIFGMRIKDFNIRHSDGIENIINIYLCIIWSLIWDTNIYMMDEKAFLELRKERRIYVFIDEIEMFLHVNIQEKLIRCLKEDFEKCCFVMTTHSPLILTRYKKLTAYKIECGVLNKVVDNLYYQDLDNIYEGFFSVQEIPSEIKKDIIYLGRVNMNRIKDEDVQDKVKNIAERIQKDYPNLYNKYSYIILKAKNRGQDDNDKEGN